MGSCKLQIQPSYSSYKFWPLYLLQLACNDRNNTIRALIRVSIVETNIIAKKKECSFVLNHTQCVMLFDAKCAYNEAPLDDEHILFQLRLYIELVCRGLEVKAKKLTKASAMAKNRAMIETNQTIRHRGKVDG